MHCAWLVALWLAAGCAHRPPEPPPADLPAAAAPVTTGSWDGRLSLALQPFAGQPAKGVTMAFSLQGSTRLGELTLSTPLGTQLASVQWRDQAAVLRTSDGPRAYPSLGALTQDILGEPLPVQAMMSWLNGAPDPALPHQSADHPAVFEQAGWSVDLRALPQGLIEANRQGTAAQRGARLKVRLDR